MSGDPAVGLCGHCRHARVLVTERSRFYRCRRAEGEAGYRRWPQLPVLRCPGHEAGEPQSATKPGGRKESASDEA